MNRIKEMLQVAADYIREFCPDQLIAYDETECDGYCVADGCELAKADLDFQLAQARREGWEQAKREAQQALCEICCYNSADNPVPDECTTCDESHAIAAMEKEKANG